MMPFDSLVASGLPRPGGFCSWRLCALLSVPLALVCACGKTKDEGRATKLSAPPPVLAAAPADALAGSPAVLSRALRRERLPAWTREAPHFFDRDGRRFACAVGSAQVGNLALAHTAAEDRARADLLRLIEGGFPEGALSGTLSGARITDTFTSKRRGKVFVRVEVDAAQER